VKDPNCAGGKTAVAVTSTVAERLCVEAVQRVRCKVAEFDVSELRHDVSFDVRAVHGCRGGSDGRRDRRQPLLEEEAAERQLRGWDVGTGVERGEELGSCLFCCLTGREPGMPLADAFAVSPSADVDDNGPLLEPREVLHADIALGLGTHNGAPNVHPLARRAAPIGTIACDVGRRVVSELDARSSSAGMEATPRLGGGGAHRACWTRDDSCERHCGSATRGRAAARSRCAP